MVPDEFFSTPLGTFIKEQSPATVVLVDFYATWCGPCAQLKPQLHALAADMPELVIKEIDTEIEFALASLCNVRSIPTCLVFQNGQLITQWLGYRSAAQMKTLLDQATTTAETV